MGQLTMTKDEREAFLAGVHVGVLAVNGDGVPSLTPIWYSDEPGGDVLMNTGAGSPKTALLRASGQASLCVQTESAPYKYVVVQGKVSVDDGPIDSEWRRSVAHRCSRVIHLHDGRIQKDERQARHAVQVEGGQLSAQP